MSVIFVALHLQDTVPPSQEIESICSQSGDFGYFLTLQEKKVTFKEMKHTVIMQKILKMVIYQVKDLSLIGQWNAGLYIGISP